MFSIIMPAWNRADLISAAIESVLAQTWRAYELLIIDDGSDDDPAAVVKPYLGENVILHRIPHAGPSAARNAGLRLARQPYIAYLDSDNRWRAEYLAVMREALTQGWSRQTAYAMAAFQATDPATGAIINAHEIGRPFDFRDLLAENCIALNAFVHARRCIEHSGVFHESLRRLADWDFILRMTSLYEPAFAPKVLAECRSAASKNALPLMEDPAADTAVRAKHARFKEPVTLVHDTISYTWDHLPPEKYHNWVRMNRAELITEEDTAWGYPYLMQVEPTTLCNLSCPLCPAGRNELERPRQHLPLSRFKSLVDDMERYLLFLVLWEWGEPFMNPELPEMIRYASERGIKTATSTNAHFLSDEAYVEAILRSGLSTLIVAVDSLDDDRYKIYRKRGSLDRVLPGLRKLVELKRRAKSDTLINMRTVVMRQNEGELAALRRFAKEAGADRFTAKTLNPTLRAVVTPQNEGKLAALRRFAMKTGVDGFTARAPNPSCGDNVVDDELVPRNAAYRRYAYKPGSLERIRMPTLCRRPWQMANIFSNGDVVPCSYDYDSSMKLGNLSEGPFTAIWNGAAYREFRRRIRDDMQSFPRCHNCTVNFHLSETGWFIEPPGSSAQPQEGLIGRWRRRLRPPLARRVLHAARRRLLGVGEEK
jgi:radical SAM protein with 4Fe4S-binding SPASM domain